MPLYKHSYRPYSGRLTPVWSRSLVLARYGFAEAWSSKITIALFTLCFLPPVAAVFVIYVANNPLARVLMGDHAPQALVIDADFFLRILQAQAWLALALASWVAPRLITFDLADNALPILLSHPISRFTYVFGKFIALFLSLSAVTWVPCLLLFAYQSYSSPHTWVLANVGVASGLFLGALLWIVFLSLLGLALSSWVKWRIVATGIIFASVFVPAGIGGIVSAVLRTKWGYLFNVPFMMSLLWKRLLGARALSEVDLPTSAILMTLLLVGCLCVAMLNARIRAREVVHG